VTPWNSFWFESPESSRSLKTVRIGICVVAVWYFASHWGDVALWFGDAGVLSADTVSGFVAAANVSAETAWRWSPLYLTGSPSLLRAYLVVGVVLAIIAAIYSRSRVPMVMLWLWCVWLANRSLLIAGNEDTLLCSSLAYLCLAAPSPALTDSATRWNWLSSLSRRMIQVHVSLLIGMIGLASLSSAIWWDGTGSVAMAAPVGRRLLDVTTWLSSPAVHESITHTLIMAAVAGPVLLWVRQTRAAAMVSLVAWCVVVGLLSSQWMFVTTIAVMLQSFSAHSNTVAVPPGNLDARD